MACGDEPPGAAFLQVFIGLRVLKKLSRRMASPLVDVSANIVALPRRPAPLRGPSRWCKVTGRTGHPGPGHPEARRPRVGPLPTRAKRLAVFHAGSHGARSKVGERVPRHRFGPEVACRLAPRAFQVLAVTGVGIGFLGGKWLEPGRCDR